MGTILYGFEVLVGTTKATEIGFLGPREGFQKSPKALKNTPKCMRPKCMRPHVLGRGVSPYSAAPETKNLKSAKYGQGVIFFENFFFALSDLGTSNKAPESFLGRFGTGKSSKNRLYRLFIFLPPSNPMAFEKA